MLGHTRGEPGERLLGDVLELRYCDGMQWHMLADSLCLSESYAKTCASAALDWVDLVGVAGAREGVGQAALF
ncbi:MAG: hypothetical protein ACLTSX_00930 [Collinsella sp.]